MPRSSGCSIDEYFSVRSRQWCYAVQECFRLDRDKKRCLAEAVLCVLQLILCTRRSVQAIRRKSTYSSMPFLRNHSQSPALPRSSHRNIVAVSHYLLRVVLTSLCRQYSWKAVSNPRFAFLAPHKWCRSNSTARWVGVIQTKFVRIEDVVRVKLGN